jgi:MtfA peptidase
MGSLVLAWDDAKLGAAEFFAVATEAFFERPRALSLKRPGLYSELMPFYRQDPVRYSAEAAKPRPA